MEENTNGYVLTADISSIKNIVCEEWRDIRFLDSDSGMVSDSVAANFEQIFETYSPTTVR